MGIQSIVKNAWIQKQNRCYEKELGRQKLTYTKWAELDEAKKKVFAEDKEADYIIWKLRSAILSKEAKKQLAAYFSANPQVQILYGDEDVMQADGERRNPFVKPCWSPDTYISYFYVGSVVAVRKSLLKEAGLLPDSDLIEYEETVQIRPLMDKLFTLAGGFERGGQSIARIPYVLSHVADEKSWESHFRSPGTFRQMAEQEGLPGISVVIPSKDNPQVLKKCLDALRKVSTELEIIVVDNGSSAGNRQVVEELTGGMKYIYEPMEFNFSRMCNMGAEQATREFLLFLNDDIEVLDNGWLQAMCSKAQLPYVGAVGLKLYYPKGDNIQHAGVVNLPIGPDHKLHGFSDSQGYYFGWNKYNRNTLAVTAACLLTETKKFRELGGFLTELAVNYNDVELCIRYYEQGYQNVVINDYYAYHHESLSRGNDERPEKMEALGKERELLYHLHPAFWDEDPYFPQELDRKGLNVKIQPAYVYAVGEQQMPCWKHLTRADAARYDQCLMVRVEICDERKLQGYGIILGDNNACYNRYLLLSPVNNEKTRLSGDSMIMKVDGVYRYELENSVPDQVNVALGGFYVSMENANLPKGRYRIGMLAEHKLSKGRLFCFSGKELTV